MWELWKTKIESLRLIPKLETWEWVARSVRMWVRLCEWDCVSVREGRRRAEAVSRGMEHRDERPEWERAEDEKWEVRELQTEDDMGFCCFCPNGAFCTFYYYFGQMVHFTPFFFFQFRLESIDWRGYRWLPPIWTDSARIGTDQPDSTRVGMSRETKKKINK